MTLQYPVHIKLGANGLSTMCLSKVQDYSKVPTHYKWKLILIQDKTKPFLFSDTYFNL